MFGRRATSSSSTISPPEERDASEAVEDGLPGEDPEGLEPLWSPQAASARRSAADLLLERGQISASQLDKPGKWPPRRRDSRSRKS